MISEDIKLEAFDVSTKKSIGVFPSISKCQRAIGVPHGSIWNCLFTKTRFTATSKKTKIKYSFKLVKDSTEKTHTDSFRKVEDLSGNL